MFHILKKMFKGFDLFPPRRRNVFKLPQSSLVQDWITLEADLTKACSHAQEDEEIKAEIIDLFKRMKL